MNNQRRIEMKWQFIKKQRLLPRRNSLQIYIEMKNSYSLTGTVIFSINSTLSSTLLFLVRPAAVELSSTG